MIPARGTAIEVQRHEAHPVRAIDVALLGKFAARRELAEEGNIDCPHGVRLVSLHFNRRASRRDHVAFYRADGVRQRAPRAADREIAESGFFALSALPGGVTPATRARLAELAGAAPSAPYW